MHRLYEDYSSVHNFFLPPEIQDYEGVVLCVDIQIIPFTTFAVEKKGFSPEEGQ